MAANGSAAERILERGVSHDVIIAIHNGGVRCVSTHVKDEYLGRSSSLPLSMGKRSADRSTAGFGQ